MENTQELSFVKGRIFNIQRFSLHDGPGVRTIVFLKGCPLRCAWCCNPESQSFEIEQINTAGILKTVGEDRTAGEILDEVERDRVYYRRSGGGGLTLSGGECLVQHDFSLALLALAKERGISTAIETTGFAKAETIKKLLPYVDTVLMDIKHMNGEKHKEFTTQDNALILENAKLIAKEAKRMVVRVPVVPTFNDTEDEIRAIAKFAYDIGVMELHLLPYHRIGSDKYAGLGRKYKMEHIRPPEKEKMEKLLKVAEECGLSVKIGG
ncbi:MAG: glycyl-radical enzyme activating protein [Clostridia bacterium]|nr:glycyl-radical enzyme activating protein [Clostridia bacterium]